MVFPGALGDFVCFLPALKRISDRARGLELEIAMRSEFSDLLLHREPPFLVRSLDCHPIGRFFTAGGELDPGLGNHFANYAFVYSWFGSRQPNFVQNLRSQYSGHLKVFPFRPRVPTMHISDYYLSCIGENHGPENSLGIPQREGAFAWCRGLWRRYGLNGKRLLVLAPGSGAKEKNWPISFYKEVSRWWRGQVGGITLVLLGPVELERVADVGNWDDAILVRDLGLGQVAALLARSQLYLGNDSGLSHLAAAVGVETVAVFGPTDPIEWRPRGRKVHVITRGVDCSPCGPERMRGCAHRRCLTGLHSSEVISHLERVLPAISLDKV